MPKYTHTQMESTYRKYKTYIEKNRKIEKKNSNETIFRTHHLKGDA